VDAATCDPGETSGYRPVSVLAVAAAGLGVASTLALVGPVFWMLPLVGTAVSWAALRDVARPGAAKAGRLAALAGLALALGCGTQAVVAATTSEWLARERAETAATFWLEAIATGRLDDARGMCGPTATAAVERVAESVAGSSPGVRFHGRDAETGGRVVRATVGDRTFDVLIEVAPPRRFGEPERFSVVRCDVVTPTET